MQTILRVLMAALFLPLLAAGSAAATDDLIGRLSTYRVKADDTLMDIAWRYGLGFVELRAANPGVDPWIPPGGMVLTLPTAHVLPDAPREGVVINIAEQRLYVFSRDRRSVETYPIGTGKEGRTTPMGRTTIVRKQANPTWYPPESIRAEKPELPKVVPPGPENPLGNHALYLGWPAYLIHGTNKPDGVGRRVSSGCIRMYPEDIERLYRELPVGTKVTVVNQPIKLGWWRDQLYIEVHPTLDQADEIEMEGRILTADPPPDLSERIVQVAGEATSRVDIALALKVVAERRGIPVRISR